MARKFICGIYQILNIYNGKCYIGKGVDILDRWNHHICTLRLGKHRNIHLQRARSKYGETAFEFRIVQEIPRFLLGRAEAYWAHFFGAAPNNLPEYNIEDIDPDSGTKIVSKETRDKLSSLFSGENHPNWGKPLAEATKEKIKLANLGKIVTEETREKQAAAKRGKPGPWRGKKHPNPTGGTHRPHSKNCRAIVGTDLKTGVAIFFTSIASADISGFSARFISRVLAKQRKTYKNHIWRDATLEEIATQSPAQKL